MTTSYYAFRYTEEGEYFMQSLIEDANEGYWESADELDKDLLEAMTDKDKQDLIDAINKI